jgi:hypothetical protein
VDAIDDLKKDVVEEFLTFLNYANVGIIDDYQMLKNKIYYLESHWTFCNNPYPVYEFLKNN